MTNDQLRFIEILKKIPMRYRRNAVANIGNGFKSLDTESNFDTFSINGRL